MWLLFQSAELLATALYGPAAHIPFEDGDAGFGQRPRSEHPSVSDPVGLASVTIVTGNGKD